MSNTLELLVPWVAHRLFTTVGPGGLVNALLGKVLDADTAHLVHVLKQADVLEVLEREDVFTVRTQGERMAETTGDFVLGMSDLPRYSSDMEVIGKAVRREDAGLVRALAREESQKAIDAIRDTGKVDAVRDVAWVVPPRVVCRYFGTPDIDPEEMRALYAGTSMNIFAFWKHAGMRAASIAAAEKMNPLLAASIRTRRARGDFGDGDVLSRLLALDAQGIRFHDGDAGIARSLAGLQSGSLNAPAGLFILSLASLLALPASQRDRLGMAARASRGNAAARTILEDHWYEAERFNAYPPYVYRYAEEDTVLARGTAREKRIPKGSTVVAWQSFAAFDADAFADAFAFVPGRPRWQYLGFGHARHRCLGEGIGQILMLEMAEALLALPGLRPAPGKAGKVQTLSPNEGKYAVSFQLEFNR